MDTKEIAKILSELGNETRLEIFRALVRAGDEGLPVGKIQEKLNVPASTLSHHISKLVNVGLITQTRESRILYCKPVVSKLNDTVNYLVDECCTECKI